MTIEVRSERPGDEDAIDIVNCSAFEEMDEANLVRLLRTYLPAYDRRLSVTAWDGDDMVGHTLLTPGRIRLMGEAVRALLVGPVAVVPHRQRTGIGGEMLRFGHELGRAEGFALTFLYGHPSYYPRHGYRACLGLGKVTIDVDKLPSATRTFRRLPVRAADIPWLVERYEIEWADVDFAIQWGNTLGEWSLPCLNTVMWWTEDGRRAAYTVDKPGKNRCQMLLADDPDIARDVIATIRPPTLSHHPSGWLARNALDPEWGAAQAEASDAGMAYELQEGVLEPYLKARESGERPPGSVLGPLPFLAC